MADGEIILEISATEHWHARGVRETHQQERGQAEDRESTKVPRTQPHGTRSFGEGQRRGTEPPLPNIVKVTSLHTNRRDT